jgi:MFS family permease
MSQYTNAFFDIYTDYSKIFTIIQFVTIVVSSILTNLITGYLSDYLEKTYFFAKPSLCIAKAASGAICCIIIFIVQDNFWISITGLCLDYLLSKGWQPIAQSILRSVVNSNYQGIAMSLFIFTTQIVGMINPVILG